jgi:hypothetical protein
MTRSGNRSAEAILMGGLSVEPPVGSATCWGKHHPSPISDRTRALPTNPKYLINGMGRLPFETTLKLEFLADR